MYPHKEFISKPDFRGSPGKMQLGRESAYCTEHSLLWQKLGLLTAFACRSKIKYPLEGHSLSCLFLPMEKRWNSTAGRKHKPAWKPLCSQLFLLSVHLCALKLGFLQVLQHLFFPELCECESICCFLSRQMLCFLLIKIGRREQIVWDEALCFLEVLKK